jgi:hypothetical protein
VEVWTERSSQCPEERGTVIPADAKQSEASGTLAEATGLVSSMAAGTGSSGRSLPVEKLTEGARSWLARTSPSAEVAACAAVGMMVGREALR